MIGLCDLGMIYQKVSILRSSSSGERSLLMNVVLSGLCQQQPFKGLRSTTLHFLDIFIMYWKSLLSNFHVLNCDTNEVTEGKK